MRFPWGFNPPKESFETRTLIGRMWKCSNALSWPLLIAREAWSYNLKTWLNTLKCGNQDEWFVLKLDNVINAPFNAYQTVWQLYFFQFVTDALMKIKTATQHNRLWKVKCENKQLLKHETRHKTPVMLGGHSGLDPPLPISNRAVKRTSANDSMLFACESRSLPSYLFKPSKEGLQKPPYENTGGFLLGRVALSRKNNFPDECSLVQSL